MFAAVLLFFTIFCCAPVFANSPECLTISQEGSDKGKLVISDTRTEILENTFRNCSRLTTITFSSRSSLRIIGANAFRGTSLAKIDIPSSVQTIGEGCFYNNHLLTEIKFGKDSALTSFAPHVLAFTRISEIEVPSNVTRIFDHAFAGTRELTKITFRENPTITQIDHSAFEGCVRLREVRIENIKKEPLMFPRSLEKIGARAFENTAFSVNQNTAFSATNNGGVVVNGTMRFEAPDNYPSKLRYVGTRAFRGSQLFSIELPPSLSTIEFGAFEGTGNLETVEFMYADRPSPAPTPRPTQLPTQEPTQYLQRITTRPLSVHPTSQPTSQPTSSPTPFHYKDEVLTLIPENCFRGSGVKTVSQLPDSVTTIGPNAFSKCNRLESIEFSTISAVNTIGYEAFRHTGLNIFEMPRNVISVGAYAFMDNAELTKVKFECPPFGSNQVLTIHKRAFDNCPKLEKEKGLEMPASAIYTGAKRDSLKQPCPTEVPTRRPSFVPTAPPSFTPVLHVGGTPLAAVYGVGGMLAFGVLMSIVTWWQQLRVY